MRQRNIAATLICTVALAVGLSAATDQSAVTKEMRQADEAAPRVIRTLPPVSFGAATAPRQPSLQTPNLDRRHAEAFQRALQARTPDSTRTICGLTMKEQSPDLDARMRLPADRSTGAAIRRIEPKVCSEPSR